MGVGIGIVNFIILTTLSVVSFILIVLYPIIWVVVGRIVKQKRYIYLQYLSYIFSFLCIVTMVIYFADFSGEFVEKNESTIVLSYLCINIIFSSVMGILIYVSNKKVSS